jgi:hypothetical protein
MINNEVDLKFYYRSDWYPTDYYDKKELTKKCTEFKDFSELKPILDKIYLEYIEHTYPSTNLDIIVFIEDAIQYLQSCPSISVMGSMQNKGKKKRFIRKKNQIVDCLCISAEFETETSLNFYSITTTDIQEVERILYDYVMNHTAPDITYWKCEVIEF